MKKEPEDESMVKLTKFLSEKRMRLVDMFRILDKKGTLEIAKDEFMRRLKVKE
jgi:Ca2+-binding EF-hand superfamily protein